MENAFWNEARAPKSAGLAALLESDDTATTQLVVDVYVSNDGHITRSVAPRINSERKRVQFHDVRSNAERTRDPRSAKEIALS